jgi:hypothetical protein
MRTIPFALAAVAILGGVACQKNAPVTNELTEDLARASSSSDLTLASSQSGPERTTVSSLERAEPPRLQHTSVGGRRTTYHAVSHPTSHPAPVATQVATEPSSAVTDEPAPTTDAVADAPAPVAARPHPVPIEGSGAGNDPGPASGGAGPIWGVIIRGGTADGDHCDPRDRRGGISISINNPFPIPHGRF